MKKIIALMLVLLLTLTVFVACGPKDDTPDTDKKPTTQTPGNTEKPGNEGEENRDPDEMHHDSTGGLENTNQHDGNGTELPIVAIK